MESVTKFEDGFFIAELMEEKDSVTKVREALGDADDDEETKGGDPME